MNNSMKYWAGRISFLLTNKAIFREIAAQIRHNNKKIFDRILPLIPLNEISNGCDTEPVLQTSEFEDGNVSNFELECICRIVKMSNPARIFEIGTFNGRTSLNMAANVSQDSMIYTLDLPKEKVCRTSLRIKSGERKFINKEASGALFMGTPYENQIIQLLGDSANFDYSGYFGTIDLVFIDGSHSYEYVVSDTQTALKLLRNGKGVILWHDYGWNEVNRALNEFYYGNPLFRKMKNIEGTTIAYLQV